MLAKLIVVLFAVSMLALTGCASSSSSPAASLDTSGALAQAAGSWSGYAGVGASSAPVSLTLDQSGSNVKGNLQIGGAPTLSGAVTGTVQGNGLSLTLDNGRNLSMMTVGDNQITGILPVGPVTLKRAAK